MIRSPLAIVLVLLASQAPALPQQSQRATALPERLDRYLTATIKPTSIQRSQLLAGAPLAKLLDADPSKEVAVFGAIWVNAPRERYVEAMKDIEHFESGGSFIVTKRIDSPPRIENFAALRLTDEDFSDLKRCRVGDCELKLSEAGIVALRSRVNFKKPTAKADAEAIFRELMLGYSTRYLEKGSAGLAEYRDKQRTQVAEDEFRSMTDRMPELTEYFPGLRQYILDYPRASLPRSTDFLYWQEAKFGLKTTLRLSHLIIQETDAATVVASKMLYASHYFWTALEIRVLVPDPARGPGFWLVAVNRSRTDGLSGFAGPIIRNRVRSEARKGTLAILTGTKNRLERRG